MSKSKLNFLLAMFLVTSCYGESKKTKVQYMPDMADSPTVKAQEDYLDPPDFSISTNAIIYPEDMGVAEEEFRNPYPNNAESQKKGEQLYNVYCALCHGKDGKGQGTLTENYKMVVPDISRPEIADRKDGFFFMKISKGGPNMPSYGHATTREERWRIITYLRKLQGKSNP